MNCMSRGILLASNPFARNAARLIGPGLLVALATASSLSGCGATSTGSGGSGGVGGSGGTGGSSGAAGADSGTLEAGAHCSLDSECQPGLKCCYPCGIPDCQNQCMAPLHGECPLFP